MIIFNSVKFENVMLKKFDSFPFGARGMDCGCTLESPCLGGSSGYPQSMPGTRNEENRCASVVLHKSGVLGSILCEHVFVRCFKGCLH